MMMVAIAALLVTDITYRQKLDLLRTSALLSRDQAYQYLMGAEELGIYVLSQDLQSDNSGSNPEFMDTLDEQWANDPESFPVPGGFIRGKLIDLQSRFNVNSLLGNDSATQREALERLLTSLEIPKDGFASDIVDRIHDLMDPDQDPQGTAGQEDLDYLNRETPFRTPNRMLFDLSELSVIEELEPNDLAKLADKLSFLPIEAPLNINTADDQVLSAMDARLAILVTGRESNTTSGGKLGFSTIDEAEDFIVQNQASGTTTTTSTSTPGSAAAPSSGGSSPGSNDDSVLNDDQFSVNSEFFLLEAEAVINGKAMLMRAVLYRPELEEGARNSDIRVKTILRKLEDPLKRV